MANRAYLYFCDDVSALTFRAHYEKSDGSDREYMDSRHQFPLAWWLFFDAQSVRLIQEADNKWEHLYLTRDWDEAKADFLRRLPLLRAWLPQLQERDVETFLNWVESLQENATERFIVVDPSELEIEDTHAPQVTALLAALEDVTLSAAEKYAMVSRWSFAETPIDLDKLRSQTFGYFYGEPAPGYFRHCLSWPDANGA